MRIFGKTSDYIWEKFGGLTVGIIVCCIIFTVNPVFLSWKPIIIEFPSIGMCAFGFLLTLLGLILQGDSETIKWMKSQTDIYNSFIDFNKRIVFISFILSFYSYLIGYCDFSSIFACLNPKLSQIISNIGIGLFCGLMVWFIIDVIQFIRLFYVLIRDKK